MNSSNNEIDANLLAHVEVLKGMRESGRYHADAERALDAAIESLAAHRGEVEEMSPEFTDTARAALLWVLWHHQGGSSEVGQPIRFALGMGAHEPLAEHLVKQAKYWATLTNRAHPPQARAGAGDAWLPIETAPRDATPVWAYLPEFDEQCVLRYHRMDDWAGWLYLDSVLNDCLNCELEPSHWQPLPAPPVLETKP